MHDKQAQLVTQHYCSSCFSYGDIKLILTSESVDEILWCDHLKPC